MGQTNARPRRRTTRQPLDRLSAEDVEILKREAGPIRGHTCKVVVLEPPRKGGLPTVEQLRASIAARLDAAPLDAGRGGRHRGKVHLAHRKAPPERGFSLAGR